MTERRKISLGSAPMIVAWVTTDEDGHLDATILGELNTLLGTDSALDDLTDKVNAVPDLGEAELVLVVDELDDQDPVEDLLERFENGTITTLPWPPALEIDEVPDGN